MPAQAVDTAEFVHDMDQLFDTFNGRTVKAESGKPYRRCLSDKSPHFILWKKLLPKISSWKFQSQEEYKSVMPFKNGWITTTEGTLELWQECKKLGFRFLRTRALNHDALNNTFASIRHFGSENTNPSCYQFIACFKTSLLNYTCC